MRINGQQLTETEARIIQENPRNAYAIKQMGFYLDVSVFFLMMVSITLIGGWASWIWAGYYTINLIGLLFMMAIFVGRDPRDVSDVLRTKLLCCSNPSIDWPFGSLGIKDTVKNTVILISSVPLFVMEEYVLSGLIVICWFVNIISIYAQGSLTLKLVRYIDLQRKTWEEGE